MKKSTLIFTFAVMMLPGLSAFAQKPVTALEVKSEVDALRTHSGLNLSQLVDFASQPFVKKQTPYRLGITGEGMNGEFDQDPIVTFEGLDCTTFVETSLSLAKTAMVFAEIEENAIFDAFLKTAISIKYHGTDGVRYESRNHFTEVDWLSDLQQKGLLKDITTDLDPNAPIRSKMISKRSWYLAKTEKDLSLHSNPAPSAREIDALVASLRDRGNVYSDQLAELKFVPLKTLLRPDVQSKFPEIMIFNLVRAEHTTVNVPVMVSHQGFVVRKGGALYFRHASLTLKKVVEQPFEEYVRERMKDTTWPTLGLNLQGILN